MIDVGRKFIFQTGTRSIGSDCTALEAGSYAQA